MSMKLIILMCLTSFLFSCANYPKNEEDVVGRYNALSEADTNFFFQFNSDNTFLQVLRDKNGVVKQINGEWRLINEKGVIYLNNWINLDAKGHLHQLVRVGHC